MLPKECRILLSNMVCKIVTFLRRHDTDTLIAPLVYLESKDKYFPSDISAQVTYTTPKQQRNPLPPGVPSPLNLDNLDQLNAFGKNGSDIYLTANDDISKDPTWILGNKPDANGKTAGTTCAVIVADKGNGRVDVFYMHFYAFNWGGEVFDQNVGNHMGDWEHTMVRFQNGVPQAVWLSAHGAGQAYKYSVLQKDKAGIRVSDSPFFLFSWHKL